MRSQYSKFTKMKYFQRLILWVAWSLVFFLCLKMLCMEIFDADLWWHLAHGRAMVESKSLIDSEIFSYTRSGMNWINFEWLGQILFYLIMKTYGLVGIYVLKITLSFVIFILFIFILKGVGSSGPFLLLYSWLGFRILQTRLFERIELFSLLFIMVTLGLLHAFRKKDQIKLRALPFIFFFLFVLWVNIHGGFIYGIGIIACLFLGSLWSNESVPYRKMLGWTLCASILGSCINPYGPRIFELFIVLLKSRHDLTIISEWTPSTMFNQPTFWLVFVLTLLGLGSGILRNFSEAKFWAPAVLLFSVWGSHYVRNGAVAAPILLCYLAAFTNRIMSSQTNNLPRFKKTAAWILAIIVLSFSGKNLLSAWPNQLVSPYHSPGKAISFIRENAIQGHIYNSFEFGGYLSWAFGTNQKIFMDGRLLFFPLVKYEQILNSESAQTGSSQPWEKYFAHFDVDTALMRYPKETLTGVSPFPLTCTNFMFPAKSWALVYWDDAALVFVKRIDKFKSLIHQHEYKFVTPYNPEQMLYLYSMKTVSAADINSELERHEKEMGPSTTGQNLKKLMEGIIPNTPAPVQKSL